MLAVSPIWDTGISIHAPLTGSDRKHDRQRTGPMYFNPRSPYGERPADGFCLTEKKTFQSTLPLRGATRPVYGFGRVHGISIHAPLTGSDMDLLRGGSSRNDFNPRSPYGERPALKKIQF